MIYIHVPFCRSFCTYCDFYSEIACRGRDAGQIQWYADSICAEIGERTEEIRNTLSTDTLYIGGGTPSVLPLEVLGRIVKAVNNAIGKDRYEEFTVEVNPDDICEDYVRGLVQIGVNRISMGVQSFDDGILKWMNRRHNASKALEAVDAIRNAGIQNLSLDLIFGIEHLTDSTLEATLEQIISLRPQHVSAYQLSIEPGSELSRLVQEGRYHEAPDEQCARQYYIICRALAAAGYRHYEISNWALPGYEARHNSAYWTRQPYVGLGPGAHSFDGSRRSWNSQNLEAWTSESETLGPEEASEEQIMLGLRTADGISAASLVEEKVQKAIAAGLLELHGDKVRIPEDKFFVSDGIISDLI